MGSRRQEAEDEATRDLSKSPQQVLADCHDESYCVAETRDWCAQLSSNARLMCRFAGLLGVLDVRAEARDKNASAQTVEVIKLTKALVIMTRVLLFFTFVQIVLAMLPFLPRHNQSAQHVEASAKNEESRRDGVRSSLISSRATASNSQALTPSSTVPLAH